MKRVVIATVMAAASIGSADAAVFNFSYTTQSGITAQGTLDATDGGGGFYSINDVMGRRDGAAITRYDFDDLTPQSFSYANGQPSNVDFSYYVGDVQYEIRWPGNGSSTGYEYREPFGATTSLLVTSFSLRPAIAPVPEPASWALMLAGFASVGAALRRRLVVSAV